MSFLHKVNKNVTPLKIIISKLKLNIIIYGGEKMNKKLKWIGLCATVVTTLTTLTFAALPSQQSSVVAGEEHGYYGKKAKYVFYFIGDGMAMPQINSAEIFKANGMKSGKLNFTNFPSQGIQTTQAANTFITESAAAGTALATGNKTNNDVLGMDPTQKIKFKTMAEMAKEKGMKVGIVSSVSLDHATPAAFYAHQPSRSNYYEIGLEMINSNFDYFAGGGLLAPTGKKKDQKDLLTIAKEQGYNVLNDNNSILNINNQSGKIIAIAPDLADSQSMQYDIDRKGNSLSLADLTQKGIETLDNPTGFFMMIEGGKIDWSGHANDATTAIKDVLAFNDAIKQALDFYAKHPDETLIVVTGDHETGGMSIGFAGTKYETFFDKLSNQKMSSVEFDKLISGYRKSVGQNGANISDWIPFLEQQFGLTNLTDYEKNRINDALTASMVDPKSRPKDDVSYLLYGGYEPLSVTVTHILNQRAGIGWTTYAHTGVAVPVFAIGNGSNSFEGYYDNTDTAKKIMKIMNVN